MKKQIYLATVATGIKVVSKLFPEYYAQEAIVATDRYIEYPFAIIHLPKPPCHILDVGCVGSYFPLLLASFGYIVKGIDVRPYDILQGVDYLRFSFRQSNILDTHIPKETFDVVTLLGTLEHIGIGGKHGIKTDDKADAKALDHIHPMLKPKGVVIITVPFGLPTVVAPHHRIYDTIRLNHTVALYKREVTQYYSPKPYWHQTTEQELYKLKPKECGLCCMVVRKE